MPILKKYDQQHGVSRWKNVSVDFYVATVPKNDKKPGLKRKDLILINNWWWPLSITPRC